MRFTDELDHVGQFLWSPRAGMMNQVGRFKILVLIAGVLAIFLAIICALILAVAGLGLYIVHDFGARWQREVDRFTTTVPLGITMEEVRAVHGEPQSITPPFEPPRSHAHIGTREDDPTTVWFYWLGDNGYLDAAYLFFDEEGKLVRVELIYT